MATSYKITSLKTGLVQSMTEAEYDAFKKVNDPRGTKFVKGEQFTPKELTELEDGAKARTPRTGGAGSTSTTAVTTEEKK